MDAEFSTTEKYVWDKHNAYCTMHVQLIYLVKWQGVNVSLNSSTLEPKLELPLFSDLTLVPFS
jgi:hypothetical protein